MPWIASYAYPLSQITCNLSTENGRLQVSNKQHRWWYYKIFIRWKMAMSVVLAYNTSIMIFSIYNRTSCVQMLVCTVLDKTCVFSTHLCNLYNIRNLSHWQSASKGHYKVNLKTNSPKTCIHTALWHIITVFWRSTFASNYSFTHLKLCLKAQWFTHVH